MIQENTKSLSYYIACLVFLIVTCQVTFLTPYVIVVSGERANVFSGLLCAGALLVAIFLAPKSNIKLRSSEIAVSFALSILAALSSVLSATPGSSSWRAFVIMSSGLGGYWCSRLLLQSVRVRKAFVYFCLGLMICVSFLFFLAILRGYPGFLFFDVGYHALGSRMMLMSFAPIALIACGGAINTTIGVAALVIAYVTVVANVYWGGVSTGPVVAIVVFLIGCAFLWKNLKIRKFLLGTCFVLLIIAPIFLCAMVDDIPKDSQSVAYRVENIFFSTHIATKHPLLGIGPFAPREKLLADYEITYPFLTKDRFQSMTRNVITSENLPLTLIAEFGLPFSLIYLGAVLCLIYMIFGMAKSPPAGFYPHPLALLLPLIGMFIQFQIFDGIYHPQVSWLFHILLGMSFLDSCETDRGI